MDAPPSPTLHPPFLYSDTFLVDVGGPGRRHARASAGDLRTLLHGSSGVEKKDPVAHWWEAQLLHYGLPRSKDKNVAKVRLLAALQGGGLDVVPAEIGSVEGRLKREWEGKVRKAKKKQNANASGGGVGIAGSSKEKKKTAGVKRKIQDQEEEGNERTTVSVRVGGVEINVEQAAMKKARKIAVEKSGDGTKAAAKPQMKAKPAPKPEVKAKSGPKAAPGPKDKPGPKATPAAKDKPTPKAKPAPKDKPTPKAKPAPKATLASKDNDTYKKTAVKPEPKATKPRVKAEPKVKEPKVKAEPKVKEPKIKAEPSVKKEPSTDPTPLQVKSEPPVSPEVSRTTSGEWHNWDYQNGCIEPDYYDNPDDYYNSDDYDNQNDYNNSDEYSGSEEDNYSDVHNVPMYYDNYNQHQNGPMHHDNYYQHQNDHIGLDDDVFSSSDWYAEDCNSSDVYNGLDDFAN